MLWLRIRLACNQFGYDLSLAKDLDAGRVYLVNNMTNSYFVLFIQALFHPKVVKKFARAVDECQRRVYETTESVLPVWWPLLANDEFLTESIKFGEWACNLALLYKQQEICKFLRGNVVLEMVKMGLGMFSLFVQKISTASPLSLVFEFVPVPRTFN